MVSRSPASVSRTALGTVKWVHVPFQVPYLHGLALQEHVVAQRLAAKRMLDEQPRPSPAATAAAAAGSPVGSSAAVQQAERVARQDYLFLLEHTPVYTEGRRKGAKEATADDAEGKRLQALGADYIVAQRGGLITFHGPGQLVGYPIWDLAAMKLSTRCYVDKLQTAFRDFLRARYGIATVEPPDDATGVWADDMHKILSIGIQVRQRITSHGFALNVGAQPLLTWFSHIVACGIEGKSMTSIERELARQVKAEEDARPDREAAPDSFARTGDTLTEIEPGLQLGPESRVSMTSIAPEVAQALGATYGRDVEPATGADARFEGDANGILRRAWIGKEEVRPLAHA